MSEASAPVEIYLQPGEFRFGSGNVRIHTLLGSCVSITLWHPHLRIGGICHFMLPSRGMPQTRHPDGRYADESLKLFLSEIRRINTRPGEYGVKLFGGGNMFPCLGAGKSSDVAVRNIEAARALLHASGFRVQAEDMGGEGYRLIIFDLRDGHVWVKHEKIPEPLAGSL